MKRHIDIGPLKEQAKGILDDNGYLITHEQAIDFGYQYRLSTGSIVVIYTTGQIVIQGKKDTGLNLLFGIR